MQEHQILTIDGTRLSCRRRYETFRFYKSSRVIFCSNQFVITNHLDQSNVIRIAEVNGQLQRACSNK